MAVRHKKPNGRPSSFTHAKADEICERLIGGESLASICRSGDMPSAVSVLRWQDAHDDFRIAYARAREAQIELYAAEIIDLADQCREGEKTKETEIGWYCMACGKQVQWFSNQWVYMGKEKLPMCAAGKPEKRVEREVTTGDMVERSRLQIDARKWLASRLLSHKYGDHIKVDATSTVTTQSSEAQKLADLMTPDELAALYARFDASNA